MKNIPNIFSTVRILLIPFFVWQVFAGNLYVAAAILALSGITDFFDGYLARKYNWITDLGKVLDPVADKLTQVSVCITFIIALRQYWYFFAALLFKDVVMLTLGSYLVKNGVQIRGAKWFGKVVTAMFYVIIVLILFFGKMMPQWLIVTMLSVVTVSALIAAAMYIPEYINYKKEIPVKKGN